MTINKIEFYNKALFFLFAILVCTYIGLYGELFSDIFLCLGVTIYSVYISKFRFENPWFSFSLFFFLYNCAYSIIIYINPSDPIYHGYESRSIYIIILSLLMTLLPISTVSRLYSFNQQESSYILDERILRKVLMILLILQFISIGILQLQGVTTKATQWENHNNFWIIATYCTRYSTYILSVLLFISGSFKKYKLIFILLALSTFYFSLLTGERDAILRFVLVVAFSLIMLRKISRKNLLILIPCGVFAMIILNYFKYYLTTGELNRDTFTFSNTLYEFLYSDFVDCGSNLQMVISSGMDSFLPFTYAIADFLSAILPSGLMNFIFGDVYNWNVSEWYNNYFFYEATWNRAFSLVGEAYVIGGLIGIVFFFFCLGLFIRILQNKSYKSPYWAALYVYVIVAIIASFRGDASTFISYMIRVPILIMFVIASLKKLLKV